MCGLTGFWAPDGAGSDILPVAKAMADRILHRGPDDEGVWTDASTGIALAHRRLSIVDVSPAGHQPMHSASGRWIMAYNGEIYNHMDLRRQIEKGPSAPQWRGHSDTETLLACFDAWGIDATLRRCTGMFAFALWDRSERALWLARDRMGEKPLYYGWQGNVFLFGSELKALRAHPAFHAAVDREALTLLLRLNYVPAPYSIHRDIRKLPPGTWLRLGREQRDARPVEYWSLTRVAETSASHPFSGSDAEALDGLEQHLGDSVISQLMADVPLGALLSGGIDSSLIVALMQAKSARPVRTFTIGFDDKQFDEAAHARAVANHLGTDHTELRLSPGDTLDLIPQLPSMYDEPFADSSQLPTHLVMKLARQHVKVALSGDGGDELFAGYNRYFLGPRTWSRIRWMPGKFRHLVAAALTAAPAPTVNRLFGPLAERVGIALPGDKAHKLGARLAGIGSLDDLYVSLVSEWPDPATVVVDGRIPPNLLDDRSRWPGLQDPVSRMMAIDGLTYLPDDILVKVDRASMAASIETRAPFLDRNVVEFAWSLPLSLKVRGGKGKWPLRQLLDRYVPRALVDRPKMGFGIPLDQWLRGPLRDWAGDLLSEQRIRHDGFFDSATIRNAWTQHLNGEASFGYRLWSVLMFQAWWSSQDSTSRSEG